MFNAHQHSTFSDGIGYPEDIVKKSVSLGYSSVALTDHKGIWGFYYLQKACKNYKVKPIYGVETDLIPIIDPTIKKSFHITLLAKNLKGLYQLYNIISISNQRDHFKKRPRIDLKSLRENSSNLIILSGCLQNVIAQAYLIGDYERANSLLNYFNKEFDFYYEIQPYSDNDFLNSNNFILKNSNIKTIATLDAHFLNPEDEFLSKFVMAVNSNRTIDEIKSIYPLYLRGESDLFRAIENLYGTEVSKKSIKSIEEIESRIENFELPQKETEITTEKNIEKFQILIQEGIKNIKLNNEYKERIKKEYNLIKEKGYIPYFLKVNYLIQIAKENNILLDYGRGSAVGSLICYILGITKVDPIKHGLLFERFISDTRNDPPDIDLDFDAEGRDKLLQVLSKTRKVLQISTLNIYKLGNLADDIGRVLKIPAPIIEQLKSTEADSFEQITNTKLLDNIPNINQLVRLEGQIRYIGRHASGYIIEEFMDKYTPTIFGNATPYDYDSINDIGLLKFDLLGLKTLTIIKNLNNLIPSVEIKYNDSKIYSGFLNQTLGIFQFEGKATQYIVKRLKPKDIEDLSLANALARPGPMISGLTLDVLRGNKDDRLMKLPDYEKITKETKGALVYQEQIMLLCRSLGIPWKETEEIRKLISKSKFDALQKYRKYFEDGYVWEKILQFGKYAFNKSHSIAYSYLSYLTAFYKINYPKEFYLANLQANPRDVRFVIEAMHKGIQFGSILENRKEAWHLVKNKLCPGFDFIYGIRDKSAQKLSQIGNKKAEEILLNFSKNFILEEYCDSNEVKTFKKISDLQLNNIIYSSEEAVFEVPVFIKKKELKDKKGMLILEDYTKVEVECEIKEDIMRGYRHEIESAERKDIVAVKVKVIPWSDRVILYGIYNLTKRNNIQIEDIMNMKNTLF